MNPSKRKKPMEENWNLNLSYLMTKVIQKVNDILESTKVIQFDLFCGMF